MKCFQTSSVVLLSVIIISVSIVTPVLSADADDDGETTTESYLIIPTTIEPSLVDESWESSSSYKNDFGVPDPSPQQPSNKPTPVRIENASSTSTQPPDAVAVAPPAPSPASPLVTPAPIDAIDQSSDGGNTGPPQVYSFRIDSSIRYRYSTTAITSRVVNPNQRSSAEIRFSILLPEMAFISRFAMEIDGKVYESFVKEKEEAKQIYNQAQSQGQSAGLVEVNARNTNTFNVNVNIHPGSKINFNLTYEELLERKVGVYEHTVNILPEQLNVKDFQVRVKIEESQNITLLRVPNPDIESEDVKDAVIERAAGNKATIEWKPSLEFRNLTKFIVNYDLVRELDSGQILLNNGYFVHFFSPVNLPSLRKHIVFILDTSGSMWGRRIEQLKEAMSKILNDLKSDDYFNVITFASDVVVWNPEDVVPISPNSHWTPPGTEIKTQRPTSRAAYPVTSYNIERAQNYIRSLVASGGTNIHDAVVLGLNLTSAIRGTSVNLNSTAPTSAPVELNSTSATTSTLPPNVETIIIFLTDGEPTVGITNPVSIQTFVRQSNLAKIPIFSLGFGDGADFPFLRRLSLQNAGFARKIYADADAALQLKGFYNEIASPLLSNVTFNYTSEEFSIENVTVSKYVTVFGGGEIVVAGKINDRSRIGIAVGDIPVGSARTIDNDDSEKSDQPIEGRPNHLQVTVSGYGRDGIVTFKSPEFYTIVPSGAAAPFPPRPTPAPTQDDWFLERLWAYLTIKQLIDEDLKKEMEQNEIEPVPTRTTTVPGAVSTSIVGEVVGSVPSNVTVRIETPKQRAIRLALKYGFVTPLTSLVVIKPNGSDVADSVSSNAPSTPSFGPSSSKFVNRISVASFAAPIPLSVHSQDFGFVQPPSNPWMPVAFGGNGFSSGPVYHKRKPVVTPVNPTYATATSITPSGGEYQPPTTTAFIRPHTPLVTLKPTGLPTLSTEPPSTAIDGAYEEEDDSDNKLQTLTWYSKGALVVVNQTDYKILENENGSGTIQNKNKCKIVTNGGTLSGSCEHLKNCIQDSFKNDFDLYVKKYFCPVEFGNVLYAGACCTSTTTSIN